MNNGSLMLAFTLLAICVGLGIVLTVSGEATALSLDVELALNDTSNIKQTDPGTYVWFNFTVKHTGDFMSEEVEIELQNEPFNWQHYTSASTKAGVRSSTNVLEILLQKGEVARMTVMVNPPIDAANGSYWMTVKVHVKEEPTTNQSERICVLIGDFAAFDLEVWNGPPVGYFAGVPPSDIMLQLAILNLGTIKDVFQVRFGSTLVSEGWTIAMVSGIDANGITREVPADPGGSNPYLINLTVHIPADALAGKMCNVTINATSGLEQVNRTKEVTALVEALQYNDFQIYLNGSNRKLGIPGEKVEFQLSINNTGNGADTFTVVPAWDKELTPGFQATVVPSSVNITSNGTALVTYLVTVPSHPPKRVYFFTAVISSSGKDVAPFIMSLEVEVAQFYGIELSCPQTRMSTLPGGILDYEIDIKNVGNGLDSMTIQFQNMPIGWLCYIQPPEISLLQGEQSKVSIRVIVPTRFEETSLTSYNITVKVDSSRSDAEAELGLQVEMEPFHRVEWMFQDKPITDNLVPTVRLVNFEPRRSINPYERDWFDETLDIRDFGNVDEMLDLTTYSRDLRVQVTVSPTPLLLRWDQSRFIKVHVVVPRDLPPGSYEFFVNATSLDTPVPTKTIQIEFEAFNLDVSLPSPPTCYEATTGFGITKTTRAGNELIFKVAVSNNGTAPLSHVLVRGFDSYVQDGRNVTLEFFNFTIPLINVGTKLVLDRSVQLGENSTVRWRSNIAGGHMIEFRAYYDHQSNTSNDVASINMTVVKQSHPSGFSERARSILLSATVIAVVAIVATVAILSTRSRRRGTGT